MTLKLPDLVFSRGLQDEDSLAVSPVLDQADRDEVLRGVQRQGLNLPRLKYRYIFRQIHKSYTYLHLNEFVAWVSFKTIDGSKDM